MTTPAERAVLDAAIRWGAASAADDPDKRTLGYDVLEAVDRLLAERTAKTPDELREQDLTWGQVVEGDEIYSPKTDRWYPVVGTSLDPDEKLVRIDIRAPSGKNSSLIKKPDDPVRLRRGTSGAAMDAFTVLWSGHA